MKIPQMIASEFRRLTSTRMSIIALIALMCVPILYGGLYLWANQNPYARLSQIPAAIVVDDSGATVNGKAVNYGETVAAQLVKSGSFDWQKVDSSTAATGVDNSRFDFSITFPADFSEALASSSGESPRQGKVTLTTNDTNSYLATTIGKQAAETIRTSIVQTVNKQAADQFLLGLATIRGNLVKATSGANQLVDGSATAESGASALASGTSQLASGASQLASGTSRVAAGAQQVASGNAQLAATANQAGSIANEAAAAVPQVRQDIIDRLTAAGVPPATISEVVAQLDPLGAKVTSGNAQVQQLVGKVDALSAGANQVASGAASAASGAASVSTGAAQASAGASSLASGLTSLHSGAKTLADGLQSGVDQIPNTSAATRAKQASTIADPVDLKNTAITSAGTYGAGLAPFFVSLAAWIGIYALFLIIKPVSRRAITAIHSPIKVTLAGWLTPGLFGAVQMIGLFVIVAGVLHFGIANPLGMFGMMAMASVTFAGIILALNVWLGSVGQFLGLVLMVVQLVTAGGTFPWQTLPGPLAALHHVLPMSYAVDGIRQLMYGGSIAAAWSDVGVLALWLAIALAVAGIGVARMTHFRTLRDLQPSLIG
jgi:putative membrane protein